MENNLNNMDDPALVGLEGQQDDELAKVQQDNGESVTTTHNKNRVQQDDEKKFSQSDVDKIIKNRLQREREKLENEFNNQLETMSAERETQLAERETALSCKEFLLDNGYPPELLEIVGAANVMEFKDKIARLDGLIKPKQTYPVYNAEPLIGRNAIQEAFAPDMKHKPKNSWY